MAAAVVNVAEVPGVLEQELAEELPKLFDPLVYRRRH